MTIADHVLAQALLTYLIGSQCISLQATCPLIRACVAYQHRTN